MEGKKLASRSSVKWWERGECRRAIYPYRKSVPTRSGSWRYATRDAKLLERQHDEVVPILDSVTFDLISRATNLSRGEQG